MFRKILFTICFLAAFQAHASHVMGGEITWKCGGNGGYIFELVFYRDCNGAEINTVSENLRVWNHPSLTNIVVNFISRTDISPTCTTVAGAPQPLDCGSGSNGGNGIGANEKVLYRSNEIQLAGTPPTQGWIFTYENYARSNAITNLNNPSTYGMTLAATMYFSNQNAGCVDNSPQFLQAPYFTSCVGDPFVYNMNAVDPDLDSLFIEFVTPMNNFPAGSYNPPINPAPVPFDPGFSYLSPTPTAAISPGSIPAQLNAQNGELTFTSTLQGNYVVKIQVSSFRQGVLIAKVEREMQLAIVPCQPNNAPQFTAPFAGGSFTTTIDAGDLINFNVLATDNGFLQNGNPQSVTLTASGPMFGTNFTASTGCDIAPCAFTSGLPSTGINQANVPFTWQTTCDHVLNPFGIASEITPYFFVFKAQDNMCQVPKVSYATIQINVKTPGIIQATALECITFSNGNYFLNWNQVANPLSTFLSYNLYSLENGLITSINNIATTSYTLPQAQANQHFYIGVVSGCNGNIIKFSDTLRPIILQLTNPNNGTAVLQWNSPLINGTLSNTYFQIFRQYNGGALQWIDSVPYTTNQYKDTVRICNGMIGYQIQFPWNGCVFTSNVPTDQFDDMLTPVIPTILGVGFDPFNGNAVTLTWNQNSQSDTYGYVVYTFDANNLLYELDTVWGIANTTYVYNPQGPGPFTYSVAAFDSCFTTSVPVTYQTSGKAPLNKTVLLNGGLNPCDQSIDLQWTSYGGHTVTNYIVYSFENNQMVSMGSSPSLSTSVNVLGGNNYTFYIQAQLSNGSSVYSNPFVFTVPLPGNPNFHYLSVATVNNDKIDLKVYVDENAGISQVQIERKITAGNFANIGTAMVTNNFAYFTDSDVQVQDQTYTYRSKFIDTCGNVGAPSNEATTMLASGIADEEIQINYITWTPYSGYENGVDHYEIYRLEPSGLSVLVGIAPPAQLGIQDSVDTGSFPGEICYYVEAHEILNPYGFQEISKSNEICLVYEPIIYVPNAFYPEGINNVFKPVATNIDPNDFKMTIMNRWSNVIYETTDYNAGWDGRFGPKNEWVANDIYIYILEFHDASGKEIIKRGNVTVIR